MFDAIIKFVGSSESIKFLSNHEDRHRLLFSHFAVVILFPLVVWYSPQHLFRAFSEAWSQKSGSRRGE